MGVTVLGWVYDHKGVGEMVKQVDFGNCHHLSGMLFCLGPLMKCMNCIFDSFSEGEPVFTVGLVCIFNRFMFSGR